jgi:hypothetical protein
MLPAPKLFSNEFRIRKKKKKKKRKKRCFSGLAGFGRDFVGITVEGILGKKI